MRIQTYDRQTAEPSSAGGVLQSGAGTAELASGKGLALLGQATEELAQRSQDAQRTTDVMLRTTGFRQAYGEWWAQRSVNNAGYQTLPTESDKVLNELGEQALKGIDDPLTQAGIQSEIIQYSAKASVDARTTAVAQQVDWAKGALEDQLFLRRQEVAAASDPVEKGRLMGQMQDMLHASAASGFISPLDAEKKLRSFVDGVFEDELQVQVYEQPDRVLHDIYSGDFERARGMPLGEETKQRLILNAEKRSEALRAQRRADERRQDVINAKRLTEAQEYNYGALNASVVNGAATVTDVMAAMQSGAVGGTHGAQLYDKAIIVAQKGGPGNPFVADDLRMKAYQGTLSTGELLQSSAMPQGLNKDETNELLSLLDKGSAMTSTRDYKEAVNYVESTLKINPLAGMKGGGGQTDAIAGLAHRELYERSTSDPNANPMAIAQDIVERFNQFPVFTPPQARFPSLDAAKAALRAGTITSREFNTEAAVWALKGKASP